MKKRFTTLPSGVVETLTLSIISSSSDRICVTSEKKPAWCKNLDAQTIENTGQGNDVLTMQQPLAVGREELEEVELRGSWWVDVMVEWYGVGRRAH
jgi:hypothetical protein